MKYRAIPILITLLVCFIGWIYQKIEIKNLRKSKQFTVEFQKNFDKLVNYYFKHYQLDSKFYQIYMHDLDAMQMELGDDGVVAGMYDPLKGLKVQGYQPLPNVIEEMRETTDDDANPISVKRVQQVIGLCDDSLNRHSGNLDRKISKATTGRFNPIVWFGYGIKAILRLPVKVLVWLNVVNENTETRISGGRLFHLVNMIITLIGFVSAIMTIALGWDQFIALF